MNKTIKMLMTAAVAVGTLGVATTSMATDAEAVAGTSVYYAANCSNGFSEEGLNVLAAGLTDGFQYSYDYKQGYKNGRIIGCKDLTSVYTEYNLMHWFK